MGELSFLTIIVSLAVCSILVFAMYQYMKVRFTILEHSQKEQALILQQYIEESSYDIQGLQSIVFRHAHPQSQSQSQHQAQTGGSEPAEVFDDHNKHIHMDTVMYEAPNKQRSALIAISSDSEDTTSDESGDSESSEGSESSDSESGDSESGDSESSGSDIECEIERDNDIHEVKHIEISLPTDNDNNNNNINELDIESVTVIDESSPEEPVAELPIETSEIKTITVDLGTSPDTSSMSTDTIDVLSLLNKNAEDHEVDTDPHFTSHISSSASASASASFQGLSVIELRALLKEKYKGQHDKITNLQKLKKPELIQLLQE